MPSSEEQVSPTSSADTPDPAELGSSTILAASSDLETPASSISPASSLNTDVYANKSSFVWTYEFILPGVRHRLGRAVKKGISAEIYSDLFGPEGHRFCVYIEFLVKEKECGDALNQDDHLTAGLGLNLQLSAQEKILGDAVPREASWIISIPHPRKGGDAWVFGSSLARYQPFTFENAYLYSIKNITKLEEYLTPDGSLRATITLNARLPPKLVEPDETFAYSSPFRKMLLNEYLSDVTLRIMDGNQGDNHPSNTIPAHKLVLSCRSRYFKTMFTSTFGESSSSSSPRPSIIDVADFSVQTIKSLLKFMYTGLLHHHQPKDLDARLDLIRAADYFIVKGLNRYIANEILMYDLNPSTASTIFEYVSKYEMYVTLRDRVGDWIRSRWDELKKVDEFRESLEQADLDIVAELLDELGG